MTHARRRARWWWVIGGVACVVVGVLGWYLFGLLTYRELRQLRRELDRTDPGWRFPDIWDAHLAACPNPKINSFDIVQAAGKTIPRSFTKWASEHGTFPQFVIRDEPPADPNTLELARFEAACRLDEVAEPLALLRPLRTHREMGVSSTVPALDVLGTLLPHLDAYSQVYGALTVDGLLAAHERNPQRAIDAAIRCVNVGRSLGEEPLLTTQLIRMNGSFTAIRLATEAINHNRVPEPLLKELQEVLEGELDDDRIVRLARCERASLDQFYDNFRTGRDTVQAMIARYGLRASGGASTQSVLFAFQYPGDHLTILNHANELVRVAKLPERDRFAASQAIGKLPPRWSCVSRLLSGLEGGDPSFLKSYHTILARQRCGIAAIAVERTRQLTGRLPNSLAEIPPTILAKPLTDPFTGEPLKLRVTNDAIVVYSVGPDGDDDGGKLSPIFHPPSGSDVGVRLRR